MSVPNNQPTMDALQAYLNANPLPAGFINRPGNTTLPVIPTPVAPRLPVEVSQISTNPLQEVMSAIDGLRVLIESGKATAQPPVQAALLESIEGVFKRALPYDDYVKFENYVKIGSPGFSEMLASNALNPIAQLFWETIKENMK